MKNYLQHTKSFKHIPRKCKECLKCVSITINNETIYQCSLFGKFKRDCIINMKKETPLEGSDKCN